MKRNIVHVLIAVLVISQGAAMLKINSQERLIANINAKMNNLSNSTRRDIDMIYTNVDEMLKQKASLVEIAGTEIGALDVGGLTVPITFTLTPKEVSESTAVSLDFDGEVFPMKKEGTSFVTTVSRSIFGDALPKVVIDENGVKKIMQDDQIGIRSIKESVFPVIQPRLMGKARFDGKAYKREGNLSVDVKEAASGIKITVIRLLTKVDDKVVSDEIIPDEVFSHGYEMNKEVVLSKGQICTMTVVAADSAGLEHHYIVDHWVAGSDLQREPWFDDEQIYTADGKLLWQSKFAK